MYWTFELAEYLSDAPWPASKKELIDYANRTGAPQNVIDNLEEIDDEEELFFGIEDLWSEYSTKEDYFFTD